MLLAHVRSMDETAWRRSYDGKGGVAAAAAPSGEYAIVPGTGKGTQNFLEADPYWDQTNIPLNTYKNKAPFVSKVISVKRIVGPQATGETCHIIMNHGGKMPYWEGQSRHPPGHQPEERQAQHGAPLLDRLVALRR